jgi:small subunit ribosomal protein S7
MNKIITNQKATIPIISNGVSGAFLRKKAPVLFSERKKKYQFNFFLFTDKFINLLMQDGKKVKAAKLFFDMLLFLKKRLEKDIDKKSSIRKHFMHDLSVLHFLSQAVENVTPSLEVRKVRVSGTTYLVPAILSKKRQETIAIRWIIESARKKQNNSILGFSECLADEIFDAYKKQGQARQKRDELHRLAEANRAYIRYRWW